MTKKTKYEMIKDEIKGQIQRGILKPNARVMSEKEICDHYGVSRISAKRALDELMWEGYIKRVRGSGSFVAASPIDHLLTGFYSLTDEIRKRGMIPTSKLLEFAEQAVTETDYPDELINRLLLYNYDHVYYLRRMRYADDEIIALENTYVPVKYCPILTPDDMKDPDSSLYKIMDERFQCRPDRAQEYFYAIIVNGDDAVQLNVNPGSAALRVVRISYSKGNPVEYNFRIYKGEKYIYRVDLQTR